ncbi:MAG TPA: DUF4333 domain-containing protein [Actinomycetota bacterium]|nr:DUF4333 domain-containing protein [Actinomycetota bacterium]
MRRLLTVALAAGLLAACSTTINTEELEQQIARELEAQTGVTPSSVDCPEDVPAEAGGRFECTATADDGSTATISVVQQDDQGNVRWEVTGTG